MNIKLANYSLRGYQRNDAKIGDKVCPANGAKSIGTIVDIEVNRDCDSWKGKTYTVLWGAPAGKAGKRLEHSGCDLVVVRTYLGRVQEEVDRINALLSEDAKFGM